MMTFFLTYSVVLMNFLNSQLTSAMTIKNEEDFINSYKDILRFPDVRIYGEAGSSLARIFTVRRFSSCNVLMNTATNLRKTHKYSWLYARKERW